jgi:hypothetical protein
MTSNWRSSMRSAAASRGSQTRMRSKRPSWRCVSKGSAAGRDTPAIKVEA